VLRHRLEKLACHFPMQENYFAWQAFARRYADEGEGPLPTYLKPEHYEAIRANVDRVSVHHASFTELLAGKPAASRDRYVLLDAQDWMTDQQLNDVWSEISRTARDGARVIFRTAAEPSMHRRPAVTRHPRPVDLSRRALAGTTPRSTARRFTAASTST
jgi:S-adenosylmethionine-diacylglycerol 3-amino-3-carboxypropyl transferase